MAEDKGLRFNEGKDRHDLVPAFAQEQYVKVLTLGSIKYAERNWERGMRWTKVYASAKRHMNAIERGEDFDKETGLLHSAHLMCNAAFMTEYYKIYPQGDDRQHVSIVPPKIGLDIDEVIADWIGAWKETYSLDTPKNWLWSYETSARFEELKKNGALDKFYLEVVQPKIKPEDIPFEPHCYITARSVPEEITKRWIENHGFPAAPVYSVGFGQSKIEVAKNSGIDIFVDDRYDTYLELNRNGICCFLMDAPHNQRYNVGFRRIHSLKELLDPTLRVPKKDPAEI